MTVQHTIPDPPPITDRMTQYGRGTSSYDFVGETITTAYDIPDSDREETLLRCESGLVILVSCDPGYEEDLIKRTDDRWEVVLYDATDTEAGKVMQTLEHGQWL